MPTKQEQLNAILAKTATQYEKVNSDLQDYAIEEIRRNIWELGDLLNEYADGDTIKKARLASLVKDLENIERSMYTNSMRTMGNVVADSAKHSINGSSKALGTAIGGFAEVGDEHFNRISAEVVRYVVNRFGEDELVLSDRVWTLTKFSRGRMESVIRDGIIRGESVNTLVANIRRAYDNDTWKIRRMVITEGNVAYRTAGAYVAQQSKFVKGLRIHRGEADRPEHRCTQLEQLDRHGLGKGVYLPTDKDVLSPHVNCTSFTTYELIDDIDETVKEEEQAEKADNTPKMVATKGVPANDYADVFKKDYFDMRFKDIRGVPFTYINGEQFNLKTYNEFEMKMAKQLAKVEGYDEFMEFWMGLEDEGELTPNINKLCKEYKAMYEKRDSLYKVKGYNVAFGDSNTKKLGERLNSYWHEGNVPDELRRAVELYTGEWSSDINSVLRGVGKPKPKTVAEANRLVKQLDELMAKNVLTEDTMVYRGADYRALGTPLAKAILAGKDVKGTTLQDLGYMSTSVGAHSKFSGEVQFQIKAPKGTKGMYVEDMSEHGGEYEWLLARGTKLQIAETRKEGNNITILCEVVN